MSYSFDTLEFGKLLELVGRNAQTPMGYDKILSCRPIKFRPELEKELAAISEAILLNEEKQVSWSFSGLEDPSDAVAVLKIRNSTLEPLLLLELAKACNQALFARSIIQPEKEFVPTLWEMVERIPPSLLPVIDKITKKILPGGEIDDSASPELSRIRREINAQRVRLTKSLESVMRMSGEAVQDQIVTQRNERFVIPVKADFRGKISGVAHGFSSSGATVFIEPLESIEANNELQNLKGKEEREISQVLYLLSEELRGQISGIEVAVAAIADLDAVKTKLLFVRGFNAVVPEISDNKKLSLVNARHPLLEDNLRSFAEARASARAIEVDGSGLLSEKESSLNIVPNSFSLTADNSIMIISGANAGGKTVVLKTAGLIALMAICGLPVPAEKAVIPHYNSILADIGDHQSLSANLSTFSSHMTNIAGMMKECREPALVLLDEAGTGTDPEEGSALGVAIVDHFRTKCNAHVIASTHYRGLKIYAANDESIINASVEFDEKTLRPTYKLLIGMAGASSGIEIASRFGILPGVIENARENLDISAQEVENYMRKLQTESKQAEDLRIALEEEREVVAVKYAGLEVKALQKEKERKREFERKLAEAIDSFERQSKAFIDTIEDKALKNKLEKERTTRKAELNRSILSKLGNDNIIQKRPAARIQENIELVESGSEQNIVIGSKVLTPLGSVGTVEKLDKDSAEILVGNIRMREKIANLRAVRETVSASAKSPVKNTLTPLHRPIDSVDVNTELNLIGRTTAEAEYELDRFIDEAYMASAPHVRIIHGFGTGALKNFVHHFLKNHELIEKYGYAPSNQGGNGATIADIKKV